uniref:Reverse transcriptase Ty1/copia-type domain-containing protein n=1 Tax=Bracon brevicornis TaxID=1563983 RepID=A0A6V7IHN0_9HYME
MSESKPITTPIDLSSKLKRNEENPADEDNIKLPYRELVGALMYLAVCTRPDIAYTVSYLSQYNSCYDFSHWTAAKRVLRYLKETEDIGLSFRKRKESLNGYVDADWANCLDDRRSYTG